MKKISVFLLLSGCLLWWPFAGSSQTYPYTTVTLSTSEQYQTITGFGASLAFYEGWLTAHPKKSEIYDVIFKELSLDILRVRNAYGYDNTMVGRVKEFNQAAKTSLGKPIDIMVTSWGPPAYLKSNNSQSNGGTLKYTVSGGKVNFQYAEFAHWWNQSLDNYNANGIYPTYVSIQNEPDFLATYESCLLKPSETVSATDTIAGYNKALDAVYDTLQLRSKIPLLLGPECVGIGYNNVENYVNALNTSKLYGIAHHLYHGTNETDPFVSTDFAKVGSFKPQIPHFQTEYSRGDWFPLAGMLYKSFNDENAVAYLFWDLIWDNGGLVDLDFPWDSNRWSNPKGYTRNKHYFVFKQFSAWVHPGWKRIKVSTPSIMVKTLAFISADKDSATFIAINTSATNTYPVKVTIPGFNIDQSVTTRTSSAEDGITDPLPADSVQIKPKSITTVAVKISPAGTSSGLTYSSGSSPVKAFIYPNPVRESAILCFTAKESGLYQLSIFDLQGRKLNHTPLGWLGTGNHQVDFRKGNLRSGTYLFRIESRNKETDRGKVTVY